MHSKSKLTPTRRRVFFSRVSVIFSTHISMVPKDSPSPRNLLASVLTDAQFWVPVAVLLAGLLLLGWIR